MITYWEGWLERLYIYLRSRGFPNAYDVKDLGITKLEVSAAMARKDTIWFAAVVWGEFSILVGAFQINSLVATFLQAGKRAYPT